MPDTTSIFKSFAAAACDDESEGGGGSAAVADPALNAASHSPAVAGDGQYIAFTSNASNIVPGDTNGAGDIFVRDRVEGATRRISLSVGGAQANGASDDPSISDDGRFVTFTSVASNLVSGDTNGAADVFLYDQTTQTVERVSVSESGRQLPLGGNDAALAGGGRYVAYVTNSSATPSASSCLHDANRVEDVYVYDRSVTRTVYQVSASLWTDYMGVCDAGGQAYSVGGNALSVGPDISASGDRVVFETDATDLGGTADTNAARDVYLRAGSTSYTSQRVSIASTGGEPNGSSRRAAISGNGRYVAFQSAATTLVSDDINGKTDIFRRDTSSSTTLRVSKVAAQTAEPNGDSDRPAITTNGERITFDTTASNLHPGDTDATSDIIEWRSGPESATRPHVILLSADDVLGPVNEASHTPAISADGAYTAFVSAANPLGLNPLRVPNVYLHRFSPNLAGTLKCLLALATVAAFADIETETEAVDEALTEDGNTTVSPEELSAKRREFNSTTRPEYWKKKADENPDGYLEGDLEKMRRGEPPIGSDGWPMELHHKQPLKTGGSNDLSNLEEMTRSAHRLGGNYRQNHP